jgi:hypothetical protein
MAINTTWSVIDMTHVDADGGVIKAYWTLIALSDGSGGEMVWGPIIPGQDSNWQNVNDSQTPSWSNVDDSQTPNWEEVA